MRRRHSRKKTLLLVCSVSIVWSVAETGFAQENEYRSPERFEKDNLHMNRKGYLIWRDVLKPILTEKELPFEK